MFGGRGDQGGSRYCGDILMMTFNKTPVSQRLDEQSIPVTESGCVIWLGRLNKGYGSLTVNGKRTSVHRLSYQEAYGAIPNGLHVCHHCDVRCCIRPDHLFLGTDADNLRDASLKGRLKKTDLQKKSISLRLKGVKRKPFSLLTRLRMSISHSGKKFGPLSLERRIKIGLANRKPKPKFTEEHKKNISIAASARWAKKKITSDGNLF